LFFMLSDCCSFIPENIINKVILIPKHNKNHPYQLLPILYKPICNKIYHIIILKQYSYVHLREQIYLLYTYSLPISTCLWYIIHKLIKKKYIKTHHMLTLMNELSEFIINEKRSHCSIYQIECILLKISEFIH
jgi:hypothetical protein